jgi:hypothetical protein
VKALIKTKEVKIALAVSLIAIVIIGFEFNFAKAALDNANDPARNLPNFLVYSAKAMAKGNTTYLNLLLHQMVQQNALNAKLFQSHPELTHVPPFETNSASSKASSVMPMWGDIHYLNDVRQYSPVMYEEEHHLPIGWVNYPHNIETGSYTEMHTRGWKHDYWRSPDCIGGESCINGYLNGEAYYAFIYVQGKSGSTIQGNYYGTDGDGDYYWCNYAIVYQSYDESEYPDYVGYAAIQSDSGDVAVCVGGAVGPFNYVWIAFWTPPYYPTDYSPHLYNDVWLDGVFAWNYYPE